MCPVMLFPIIWILNGLFAYYLGTPVETVETIFRLYASWFVVEMCPSELRLLFDSWMFYFPIIWWYQLRGRQTVAHGWKSHHSHWLGDGIAGGLRDRAQTTTSVVERLTFRQRFISRLNGPWMIFERKTRIKLNSTVVLLQIALN